MYIITHMYIYTFIHTHIYISTYIGVYASLCASYYIILYILQVPSVLAKFESFFFFTFVELILNLPLVYFFYTFFIPRDTHNMWISELKWDSYLGCSHQLRSAGSNLVGADDQLLVLASVQHHLVSRLPARGTSDRNSIHMAGDGTSTQTSLLADPCTSQQSYLTIKKHKWHPFPVHKHQKQELIISNSFLFHFFQEKAQVAEINTPFHLYKNNLFIKKSQTLTLKPIIIRKFNPC